jgi:hypothetical protein
MLRETLQEKIISKPPAAGHALGLRNGYSGRCRLIEYQAVACFPA